RAILAVRGASRCERRFFATFLSCTAPEFMVYWEKEPKGEDADENHLPTPAAGCPGRRPGLDRRADRLRRFGRRQRRRRRFHREHVHHGPGGGFGRRGAPPGPGERHGRERPQGHL